MSRIPFKLSIDLCLWLLAAPLAFYLRLDDPWPAYARPIALYAALGLPLKLLAVHLFALPRQSWTKVGVLDLSALLRAVGAVTAVLFATAFVFQPQIGAPRSIPLIEALVAVVLLGGVRLGARLLSESARTHHANGNGGSKRVLLVGAGEAGTMIAREMLRHPEAGLVPVGFVDDDPAKRRERFVGLPVLGAIADLPAVAASAHAHQVLIAMPSAAGSVVRRVVDLAREAKLTSRIIPGVYEILSGKVAISSIREVDLEDLLRRDAVQLTLREIAAFLEGRTVLVTGAGGSIGSEIVRQVARFKPKRVVLLGRGENSLYQLEREIDRSWPDLPYTTVVADVRHRDKLADVFRRHRPEVVFHAAAHKHVPLMETNADEAILNNVGGTRNLVELSLEHGVERFVNVSTDKAVNPTSVMGASKRVAEHVVEHAARRGAKGQVFVSVRFGNVLGSRGSVIPLFKEQIRKGGPVTVTDPEMTRYFMTIPEASQLVLEAAGIGENGSVYVLDMGEPVKIVDLARELIRLSGLEPDEDVRITFTGQRPGEKLFEELLTAEEGTVASRHEKIFVAKKTGLPERAFEGLLDALLAAAARRDDDRIREALGRVVETYRPAGRRPSQSTAASVPAAAVAEPAADLLEAAPRPATGPLN